MGVERTLWFVWVSNIYEVELLWGHKCSWKYPLHPSSCTIDFILKLVYLKVILAWSLCISNNHNIFCTFLYEHREDALKQTVSILQRQETWDAKNKYKHKIKERREATVSSIQDHSAKLVFLIKTAIIMFKPSNSNYPSGLYRSKGAYPTQVTTNSSCTLIMQFKFRVEQLKLQPSVTVLSWIYLLLI